MSNFNPSYSAVGTSGINPSCFVVLSAVADNCVAQASGLNLTIGISSPSQRDANSTVAALSGDNILVFGPTAICQLQAGASGGWTRGDMLGSDNSGFGFTLASGSLQAVGAFALESALSGQIAKVMVAAPGTRA